MYVDGAYIHSRHCKGEYVAIWTTYVYFLRVDKDRSGAITVDELQSALSNGKTSLKQRMSEERNILPGPAQIVVP